ncbi:MAG: class A beta-lactamase [Deltaproteobacteria bacterium]|nr:class A beta-lactamase [Deltaproteobacteria bacterium]
MYLFKIKNLIFTIYLTQLSSILLGGSIAAHDEITPYKFTDQERSEGVPKYQIPAKSRFTTPRPSDEESDIVYYLSKPKKDDYPIAFFLTGSSSKEDVSSVIHVHRFFLKEFLDIGAGVLTVEQQGVDGERVDLAEFWQNYTRTERFIDHRTVIKEIIQNPPRGWNGKIIFVGVSEGGPLVTKLTSEFQSRTIATVNWSGAGDWSWPDELWAFLEQMRQDIPWYVYLRGMLPKWAPFSIDFYLPSTRTEFDQAMTNALNDPSTEKSFLGMSHKYHADAMKFDNPSYQSIKTPFLVVAGAKDSIIHSTDAFVDKAKKAGMDITYFRIDDMDHYIRKRPDIVKKSFDWLNKQIHKPSHGEIHSKIFKLESQYKSRIGVYAFEKKSGKTFEHRSDERFPFCSSFKFLVSAATLANESSKSLDEVVKYKKSDLVSYSPFTAESLSTGMSVKSLCRATHFSDNAATNLLIKRLGGIEAVNKFARSLGDHVFRLDRMEPDLNTAIPGDKRDTSTPRAMTSLLSEISFGETLDETKRNQLISWLLENNTGMNRIQAGVPSNWKVGDKTGTCAYGTTNDVGIVFRPDGSAVVVTVFVTHNAPNASKQEHLIPKATKIALKAIENDSYL